MTKSCSLYRMFDADGRLLYIGMTSQGALRLDQHRSTQPWWTEVSTVTVEHFDSVRAAAAAERDAILTEQPHYDAAFAAEERRRLIRAAKQDAAHAAGRLCTCHPCARCTPIRQERMHYYYRTATEATA